MARTYTQESREILQAVGDGSMPFNSEDLGKMTEFELNLIGRYAFGAKNLRILDLVGQEVFDRAVDDIQTRDPENPYFDLQKTANNLNKLADTLELELDSLQVKRV